MGRIWIVVNRFEVLEEDGFTLAYAFETVYPHYFKSFPMPDLMEAVLKIATTNLEKNVRWSCYRIEELWPD